MNALFSWLGQVLMSGRGQMHLYHPVFFYLALVIVFLDEIFAAVWLRVISACFLFGSMVAMTIYLVHADPNFLWWEPLALLGFCGLIRLIKNFVSNSFGFSD